MKRIPLGIRNNNPLNIRRVPGQHWKGEVRPLSDSPEGENKKASPRGGLEGVSFCKFSSLEYGLRAAFILLRTYTVKYKAVCIEDIIARWAPPSENDTKRYIETVCKLTGFGGRERLTEAEWPKLVRAMGQIECGALLSEEIVQKAFELYKGNSPTH